MVLNLNNQKLNKMNNFVREAFEKAKQDRPEMMESLKGLSDNECLLIVLSAIEDRRTGEMPNIGVYSLMLLIGELLIDREVERAVKKDESTDTTTQDKIIAMFAAATYNRN